LSEAIAIVETDFATAPVLIPIFGHRYIPSRPHAAGNPIFSVAGVDIIHYGKNLFHYLDHEFRLDNSISLVSRPPPIDFWDDFLSQNR
jgi:hypothetical protein